MMFIFKSDKNDSGKLNPIQIKIRTENDELIAIRFAKNKPLRILMEAYYKVMGKDKDSLRFRFDGQPVSENDTVETLKMVEGDTIEIYNTQIGGKY